MKQYASPQGHNAGCSVCDLPTLNAIVLSPIVAAAITPELVDPVVILAIIRIF